MPLYALVCPECGNSREEYCHTSDDRGAATHLCLCGSSFTHILSLGTGLTYFEEGRARVIENLGPTPVTVRSHEEHKSLMRRAGVEWATPGRGRKGSWV